MEAKIKYEFISSIWKSPSASWHFASLPESLSKEIRNNHQWEEEGWGRLKIIACINKLNWETAIWFDTKLNTYLLPIKAEIRRKQNIKPKQELSITLYL